jgi:hypothetical protein
MESSNKQRQIPLLLYFSAISSITLILLTIYQWHLVDLVTVFLMGPVLLLVWALFISISIWSIVYAVRTTKKNGLISLIPLLFSVVTILIVTFVPFTDIMLTSDFEKNLEQREYVVSLIQSGELKPNVSYNESLIRLPLKYRKLSKGGGEIMVEREGETLKVFFFTFRGVLDNFSGYAYISDDSELQEDDFFGDFKQINKVKEHWYWGSSY